MRRKQRGAAFVTSLLALPVLGALIGGSVQLGLLYQARAVLNHAVQTAARAGAHDEASANSIYLGLARGLAPLFVSSDSYVQTQATVVPRALVDVRTNSCVNILSPAQDAFADFDRTAADPKKDNTISFYELSTLDNQPGAQSKVSIQDAMQLRLYVVYGLKANVPVIGPLVTRLMILLGRPSGKKLAMLQQGRIPIVVQYLTRMQSNARLNGLMVASSRQAPNC